MSWLSKAISRNKKLVSTGLALIPGVGGVVSKGFDLATSGGKSKSKTGVSTMDNSKTKRFKIDGKFIVG